MIDRKRCRDEKNEPKTLVIWRQIEGDMVQKHNKTTKQSHPKSCVSQTRRPTNHVNREIRHEHKV